VAELPDAAGRVLDARPDAVTYDRSCVATVAGRRKVRILAVPVAHAAPVVVLAAVRHLGAHHVARALVEGLEHDFVANDAALRSLVPRRLMGLEEAIRAAIEADSAHSAVARWSRVRSLPQLPPRVRASTRCGPAARRTAR